MSFNHNHSYRWVSQPRQFSGQNLEFGNQHSTLDQASSVAYAEIAQPKVGLLSDVRALFESVIQQFRQQPQNL